MEVRPGIFWFHPPTGGEVHVVRTTAGLVLFDANMPRCTDAVLDMFAGAGLDPAEIKLAFVTHFHCDHAGAMGDLQKRFGFRIVAHECAVAPMETPDLVVTGTRIPYVGFDEQFIPCRVDHPVKGGESFTVGERRFEVIYAPGHTIGSIHIRLDDVLFVGDTVYADGGIGWLDVHWGSHPGDLVETLERMRAHLGSFVLPGHGSPYVLSDAQIRRGQEIASYFVTSGHGLGSPRAPSQYR
jgi:glyoxylase-like metal-dependent hydrolase (beta-lactamase superfamily II)